MLKLGECLLQNLLVLLVVDLPHSYSRLTEFPPASVVQLDTEDVLKSRGNKTPTAHVPVLLLRPNKSFNFLVFFQLLLYSSSWEGTETFKSDDGRPLYLVILGVFSQGVEMFA